MKKFFLVLNCFLLSFLFVGCGSVEHSMIIGKNGEISVGMTVVIDGSKISNFSEVVEMTEFIITNYIGSESSGSGIVGLVYKFNQEVEMNQQVAISHNISESKTKDEVFEKSFRLTFPNIIHYQLAMAINSGIEKDLVLALRESLENIDIKNIEPVIENGFLFKRQIILKQPINFYSNIQLVENIESYYKSIGVDDISNVTFRQVIVYPDTRIRSNGQHFVKDGNSYNVFTSTRKDLENQEVILYVRIPNIINWYLLCGGLTIVFMCVLCFYFYMLKYCKREK